MFLGFKYAAPFQPERFKDRLLSKIDGKFRTFWPSAVILENGRTKWLSFFCARSRG